MSCHYLPDTSFGDLVDSAPMKFASTSVLNPEEGRWAKFIFQYRPEGKFIVLYSLVISTSTTSRGIPTIDILRAQGIVTAPCAPRAELPTADLKSPPLKRSRSADLHEPTTAGPSGSVTKVIFLVSCISSHKMISFISKPHPSRALKRVKAEHEVIDLTDTDVGPPRLLDPTLNGSIIDLTEEE